MKKIIAAILVILIIFNSLTIISFASGAASTKEVTELDSMTSSLFPHKSAIMADLGITEEAYVTLATTVYNALQSHKASIDISGYNLSNTKTIRNALAKIFYYCYTDFSVYGQSMGSYGGKLFTIYIGYTYDAKTTQKMMAEIEAAAERFLVGLDNPALSDETKALLLHDRIINSTEYSPSVIAGNAPTADMSSMYGALVNGDCVCEGYSRAFSYLLGKLGIMSQLNESNTLGHVWNLVDINGKLYQTDLTYDDPYYDMTGRVLHKNFLVSDSTFYSNKHEATDYHTGTNDTSFENEYWLNSTAEVLLVNGEVYYYDNNNARLIKQSDGSIVYKDTDPYWRISGGYWTGNYTRISEDGKYIYLSLRKDIIKIDPKNNIFSVFYSPDLEYTDFNIFGFKVLNNCLYIDRNSSPNFTADTRATYQIQYHYESECEHDWIFFSVILEPTFKTTGKDDYICSKCEEHTTVVTPYLEHWQKGDLNNDSKVNAQDTNMMISAILGTLDGVQLLDAADINNDNKVNAVDANMITMIVIGK